MQILYAVAVLGGMGVIFGVALGMLSKKLSVASDALEDEILALLPGANCGGCGLPGCSALASKMAAREAPADACPVCSADQKHALAEVLGVTVNISERMIPTVICRGGTDHCKTKYDYTGEKDCVAVSLIGDGDKACKYACLGYGTCVKVCKFDAIHIDENRLARVDPDKCKSCGACIDACPKNVLRMEAAHRPVRLRCRANEKGKMVTELCSAGCIGCGKCEKSCKFGAIEMVNNLPVLSIDKCVGCMMCAEVCPTGAMWGNFDHRNEAYIKEKLCIGCGICKKQCLFDAIEGKIKSPHKILPHCTGCGKCVSKCPRDAIVMRERGSLRQTKPKAQIS